ncbi:unnamed protein product [Ilex paraguariensis]|uniref:SBP-type domain-containing protein n=1 Tax=Ilex paraguariensis TaxID=185542 RepID=A0ABC8RH71_9AQUA
MNSFSVMEWNAKWDWETLVMFSSKGTESPTKLQLTDWGSIGDGEIDAGSFHLSGGSGGCGSNGGNGPSVKSSMSASTNSSSKDEMKTSHFTFEAVEDFPRDFSKKEELAGADLSGTSPPLETSVGSGESLIGLKLGKRTYFENNCPGNNNKTTSLSAIPVASAMTAKKIKSSCRSAPTPRCQVEGCNLDLSSSKDYHRKHRVCESHSKSPQVAVGGLERRFCQQCSRFHSLSEFDDKKRSCRRRLSDHNARRRKPQQEAFHFNSTGPSFYDGRQQNFVLNNAPRLHSRPATDSTSKNTPSSKFTLTNGYALKPEKAGNTDGQPHSLGLHLPHTICMPSHDSGTLISFQGTTADVNSQGSSESRFPCTLDPASNIHRALSLLSNTSWGSCEPKSLDHPMHVTHTSIPQHVMHTVPQGLPLASSEYWRAELQSTDVHAHTMGANSYTSSHLQETELFKTPFEAGFFSNPLN